MVAGRSLRSLASSFDRSKSWVAKQLVRMGVFTLRHGIRLHHIAAGRGHKGRRIIVLVCDLDIRVLSEDGEPLRHLTPDPSKDYQPITGGS